MEAYILAMESRGTSIIVMGMKLHHDAEKASFVLMAVQCL